MIGRMEISYENHGGEEVVIDLPCKKVVCYFCKGEGAHLCDGMRGVAFTQEDMADWEDDERAALALIEELTLISNQQIPDEVYAEAQKYYSEEQLSAIEWLGIVINAWNRIAISSRYVVKP